LRSIIATMPKTPRTRSSRKQKIKQTDSVASPYLGLNPTASLYFSCKSSEASLVKDSDEFPDELHKYGIPPYNSYWGALARAARSKPRLIQGA
jgi:hypothetical protein